MSALCTPDDASVCIQCNALLPQGLKRTCPKRLDFVDVSAVQYTTQVTPVEESVSKSEPDDVTGLGDLAAEFFASLGVTPETYQATKAALHLGSGCRCDKRKRWLNAVGDKLGINDAATAMAGWLKGRRPQVATV